MVLAFTVARFPAGRPGDGDRSGASRSGAVWPSVAETRAPTKGKASLYYGQETQGVGTRRTAFCLLGIFTCLVRSPRTFNQDLRRLLNAVDEMLECDGNIDIESVVVRALQCPELSGIPPRLLRTWKLLNAHYAAFHAAKAIELLAACNGM